MSDSTPFTCPICFDDYDGHEATPSTLPCGHTCCITHLHLLNGRCYQCRQEFNPDKCHISYALRDGSILYWAMRDSLVLGEKSGSAMAGKIDPISVLSSVQKFVPIERFQLTSEVPSGGLRVRKMPGI